MNVRRLVLSRSGAAWLTVAIAFVAFVLAPAIVFGLETRGSDQLYLTALYRDLFVDRIGMTGWTLQPAPSFFPDAAVYFTLRAILGHGIIAIAAYEAVFVTALVVLISDLAKQAGAPPWARRVAAIVAASAITLSALFDPIFAFSIFPSAHGAATLMGLVVLSLVARQLGSALPRPLPLAGIVLVCAATTASDRIFLLFSGVPIAAALTMCALSRVIRVSSATWSVLAIGLGGMTMKVIDPLLARFGVAVSQVPLGTVDLSWDAVAAEVRWLATWGCQPVVAAISIGCFFVTLVGTTLVGADAVLGRRPKRRPPLDERHGMAVLLAMSGVLSIVLTVGVTTTTHALLETSTLRYLQPAFVVPLIAVPLFVAMADSHRVRVIVVAATALGAYGVFHVQHKVVPPWHLAELTLTPPDVECIDEVAARYDTRYGFTYYWGSHRLTELSREHVRLFPVNSDISMFRWISNKRWFTDVLARQPRFLVAFPGIKEAAARARFGEPRAQIKCPGVTGQEGVWVYDGAPRSLPLP